MCVRSLANACHSQSRNSRVLMLESWVGGKRPLNTGMAHWSTTCRASSANQYSNEQSLYLEYLLKKPCRSQTHVSNVRWKTADGVETEGRDLREPKIIHVRNCFAEGSFSLPFVEYLNPARINSMCYSEQVFQDTLQDSKLKLMQQIHD